MGNGHSDREYPFVSVIIPFRNNFDEAIRVTESIGQQSYPSDKFEMILIDNGSEKEFSSPPEISGNVRLLEENRYLNSPYSARNRGIEASKGELVVFIDANSTPAKNWLEEGVRCLVNTECDAVGGKISFDFQGAISAAKIVDSITSINMEKAIRERGVAYTANLFAKKELFEKVGYFEEGVRSGGDVRWTMEIGKRGYKMAYCEAAVVSKNARTATELYKKRIRTGKGYFYTWKLEDRKNPWFYNFFRSLKPPSFSTIEKMESKKYRVEYNRRKIGIWIHMYLSRIVEQVAFISEFFRFNLRG